MLIVAPDSAKQKKHLLMFTHDYLVRHVADGPPLLSLEQPQPMQKNPDAWFFNSKDKTLAKADNKILLTGIESLVIKQMMRGNQRVLSKADLILGINRDPERYSGLEMCLSRLQEKFSSTTSGERLFRSVRNRGYCLCQQIEMAY